MHSYDYVSWKFPNKGTVVDVDISLLSTWLWSSYPAFPRLLYLTDNSHRMILATSWERCIFTRTGHLSFSNRLSAIVTHINKTNKLCLLIKLKIVSSPHFFMLDRQTSLLCVDNRYHSHTLTTQSDHGNTISVARQPFGKRTPLWTFATETSHVNRMTVTYSGPCMAAVILQILQLQAQVMLASLAWYRMSGECAKSYAHRPPCFDSGSARGASILLT